MRKIVREFLKFLKFLWEIIKRNFFNRYGIYSLLLGAVIIYGIPIGLIIFGFVLKIHVLYTVGMAIIMGYILQVPAIPIWIVISSVFYKFIFRRKINIKIIWWEFKKPKIKYPPMVIYNNSK